MSASRPSPAPLSRPEALALAAFGASGTDQFAEQRRSATEVLSHAHAKLTSGVIEWCAHIRELSQISPSAAFLAMTSTMPWTEADTPILRTVLVPTTDATTGDASYAALGWELAAFAWVETGDNATRVLWEVPTELCQSQPLGVAIGLRNLGPRQVSLPAEFDPNWKRVPARNAEGAGLEDRLRLGVAAMALGIADTALTATVNYLRSGKALPAQEQTLHFMLSDLATELRAAELSVEHSAQRWGQTESHSGHCAAAKLYSCEMNVRALTTAVQIVGQKGYTCKLASQLSDARFLAIYPTTSERDRNEVARQMLKD